MLLQAVKIVTTPLCMVKHQSMKITEMELHWRVFIRSALSPSSFGSSVSRERVLCTHLTEGKAGTRVGLDCTKESNLCFC